jgi:NAD+ dependent glucose-6-phosphate dehydrogenase
MTKHTIKKVGITGSAGNIGSTLQKGLCDKYALSLFDARDAKPVCDAPFTKVDFGEQKNLKGVFDGLDALIHLAGNPRPDAPAAQTYRNNFEATTYIFEEARSAGRQEDRVRQFEFSIMNARSAKSWKERRAGK